MKTATLGQIRKILDYLEEVPQEQVQSVLGSGLLNDLLLANIAEVSRAEFRKVCGLVPLLPFYKVVVDYTKTLAEMISVGNYDWVNSDITNDHFPVKGEGKQEQELVLFHFNRAISSDDAMKKMEEDGYKPAVIEELLALGESQPELQRQFPIVALGSVWRDSDGGRRVPSLDWCDAERDLDLSAFELDWREDYRFLARRK